MTTGLPRTPEAGPVPSFDDDTALVEVAPGTFRGAIVPTWFSAVGVNGGLLAAQITRAMVRASRPGLVPRALTVQFLSSPPVGPVDHVVTVERAGRAVSYLRVRTTNDAGPVATATGVLVDEGEDHEPFAQRAGDGPQAPPPGAVAPSRRSARPDRGPSLVGNYDVRRVWGGKPMSGSPDPVIGGWLRTAAPRPLDAVALAAYTDAWWPTVLGCVREPAALPTLTLTVYWRGSPPPDPHPWVLCRFRTRQAGGGLFDEDGELWSEDGRLLAQSRQLALMRPLAPR